MPQQHHGAASGGLMNTRHFWITGAEIDALVAGEAADGTEPARKTDGAKQRPRRH